MVQLDFFYHNRTPSYASMSTISGHADHAHEAALINTRGTYSAEVGQNPLAECVPPDRIR